MHGGNADRRHEDDAQPQWYPCTRNRVLFIVAEVVNGHGYADREQVTYHTILRLRKWRGWRACFGSRNKPSGKGKRQEGDRQREKAVRSRKAEARRG